MFGYARLDDRLQDSELWRNAHREEGRDPMGLTDKQPNIELWNTELYGGPKQYADFPIDHKHTFAMCSLLFNQHSRGSVSLKSSDPLDNPVVDHNYLKDPLDLLVMTEGCRVANEIVMSGKGTKDLIKGSWPADLTHHKNATREDWESHVKQHATTCTSAFLFCFLFYFCFEKKNPPFSFRSFIPFLHPIPSHYILSHSILSHPSIPSLHGTDTNQAITPLARARWVKKAM
jgi:choline dehydrogenase-like flavoprotein